MPDAFSKYCDARDALNRGDVESSERLLVESLELNEHFKTHELLGDIFTQRGDDGKAFEHFSAAYSQNSRSDSTATKFARALLESGRPHHARSIIDSVLDRNPSYGPACRLSDEFPA